MHQSTVGIIGMGWVGASTAISILHKGLCKRLLLNDVKPGIAEGEAMDLNHGSAFLSDVTVEAVSVEEMKQCDIVVITAGRGGKPGETRLQLLQENVQVAQEIGRQLQGYQGVLVIVANPVDVLTHFYRKFSGLPAEKVIGTGTLLDTARLRDMLGDELQVSPKSIHAQVVGEHGDSEVVLWSSATISGMPLKKWKNWSVEMEDRIAEQVRKAAYEIVSRKGATNHAIGLVTANLIKWILRDEHRVVTVASSIDHIPGMEDVALSLPSLVSKKGVEKYWLPDMNTQEEAALERSAQILREAINSVSI